MHEDQVFHPTLEKKNTPKLAPNNSHIDQIFTPSKFDEQLNVSSKPQANPYEVLSVDQEIKSKFPTPLEDLYHYAVTSFPKTSAFTTVGIILGLKFISSGVINTLGNIQKDANLLAAIDQSSFLKSFISFGLSAGLISIIVKAKSLNLPNHNRAE